MHYILSVSGKILTTNAERAGNRWARAGFVSDWRKAFAEAAREEGVPPMQWINVTVQPFQKRGPLQDTAACNPAAKAAIDGLVDAGVVPDDTGEYVRQITFLPCVRGDNQLTIIIQGVREDA